MVALGGHGVMGTLGVGVLKVIDRHRQNLLYLESQGLEVTTCAAVSVAAALPDMLCGREAERDREIYKERERDRQTDRQTER